MSRASGKLKRILPPFFTLNFFVLCLSSFLFFASFNMIIPELPSYLSSLGGEDYKGLIISLFTLTAGLSRPFSGKLADKIGRIPVMVFGAIVCFVISMLYPVITSVAGFLLLRFVHGFSTGFTPTGTSAFVADIVPFNRRGEAMGIQSLFGSLGMAAGPAAGGYIAAEYGINPLFYASAATAILSILIILRLKETLEEKETLALHHFKLQRHEIIEKRVLPPSLVLFLTVFSFGVVLTIIPDYSEFLGIKNKGLFFAVFTLSSLGIRIIAGKASDKYGRIPVMKIASLSMALAMLIIALASTKTMLLFGGVVFGASVGMNSPTISAWTIDLSLDKFRGRALATMYIALEAGIGIGAITSGFVFQNKVENFFLVFSLGTITSLLAFIYLLTIPKNQNISL
ncbi:Predicted arabinose efflux permease, MFS family [Belliella buryatensis]|uniref:Predicted arabinose efflux permease, MFS family n=1 Tax=Belliella buryatensis TaxID=1500549 RepID=A0A239AED8_9BACT|nr:MFS transporter [Belliella buryatensis]SNR93930.1 Predicted arabinose efflux permease, MFS family [Belliella buryatensis]